MALQGDTAYEFDTLPLNPIDSGSNVLVSGPTLDGTRELVLRLLLGDDGVVVITADTSADQALAAYERLGGTVGTDQVRVVDCTQRSETDREGVVSSVGTPADLTGIGIEYANQYEQLYARGYDSVRTGIYTLTPLLMYSDDVRPVFRFINTVTSRIRTADGLGICAIDPEAHDSRVVASIAQPFDARVEVRRTDDDIELRIRGLRDQPTEWTPVHALR